MMALMPSAAPTPSTTSSTLAASPGADAAPADWLNAELRISVEEFLRLPLGAVTIVDVRDAGVYEKGHISGAVLIPLEEIEPSLATLKSLKRPLVTYCS
jgi:hypothetical protein